MDAMSGREQFQAVIEGVFAGNIFDMVAEGDRQGVSAKRAPIFLPPAIAGAPAMVDR